MKSHSQLNIPPNSWIILPMCPIWIMKYVILHQLLIWGSMRWTLLDDECPRIPIPVLCRKCEIYAKVNGNIFVIPSYASIYAQVIRGGYTSWSWLGWSIVSSRTVFFLVAPDYWNRKYLDFYLIFCQKNKLWAKIRFIILVLCNYILQPPPRRGPPLPPKERICVTTPACICV